MSKSQAEIIREYGPFPGIDQVHGVTFDGRHVWFASGGKLNALDPNSGKTVRFENVGFCYEDDGTREILRGIIARGLGLR